MSGLLGKCLGLVVAAGTLGTAVLTTGMQQAVSVEPAAAVTAMTDIPASYLRDYRAAARRCPGLEWTVLAGVGKVETDHGRAAHLTSTTGAQGPMQFEPATWARYGIDGDDDGRADPFDPADAIASAATYLCALGVATDVHDALVAYTCGNIGSACQAVGAGYAATVLRWASAYGHTTAPITAASVAIRTALAQLGTPYVWGGDDPRGFDCSGLVQWVFAHAGIALPRVAQAQYNAGPAVGAGAPLLPGDLLFFGTGTRTIDHVGIYLGDGRMVDAPHTGASVRVEPVDGFNPPFVGATRPAEGGTT